MKDSIDRRVITKEFLLTYFPSPDRYAELTKKPIPSSTLAVSEERYKIVKEKINKAFQGSNTTLSDKHWTIIAEYADGIMLFSRSLKPNKQL